MKKEDFLRINNEWTEIAAIITENEPLPSMELEAVACPECGAKTITFSFSLREQPTIGESFYITCRTCRGLAKYIHFHLSHRPKGFAEYLIHPFYQAIEDRIQAQMREVEDCSRSQP